MGGERAVCACVARSPGLSRALLVDGPDPLASDGQPGDVHQAGVSTGVAELQDAVPLTLHPTHHGTAGVVLHLGRHPERERERVEGGRGADGGRTVHNTLLHASAQCTDCLLHICSLVCCEDQ